MLLDQFYLQGVAGICGVRPNVTTQLSAIFKGPCGYGSQNRCNYLLAGHLAFQSGLVLHQIFLVLLGPQPTHVLCTVWPSCPTFVLGPELPRIISAISEILGIQIGTCIQMDCSFLSNGSIYVRFCVLSSRNSVPWIVVIIAEQMHWVVLD